MNIHDKAALFGRFDVAWTPTVLIMSPKGVERWRLEGYLDRYEFNVWLRMGLGRVEFMAKRMDNAQEWYEQVMNEYRASTYHAEAMYWEAVCRYNLSHEATPLQQVAVDLYREHQESIWAMKCRAWLPADHPANRASLR